MHMPFRQYAFTNECTLLVIVTFYYNSLSKIYYTIFPVVSSTNEWIFGTATPLVALEHKL